jgi:hypothetical protein
MFQATQIDTQSEQQFLTRLRALNRPGGQGATAPGRPNFSSAGAKKFESASVIP